MAKKKVIEWESNVDNKDYAFKYVKIRGAITLKVNDEELTFKRESVSVFLGADIPFSFDGKEARLVQHGKKIDIFYDEIGLRTNEKYIPIHNWAWVLVGPCLLIPIISGGLQSIFSAIIGLIGVLLYRLMAKKKPSPMIYDILVAVSIFRGGVIPITLGIVGADLCLKILRKNMTMLAKILLCILIAIMAWIATIIGAMIFYTTLS